MRFQGAPVRNPLAASNRRQTRRLGSKTTTALINALTARVHPSQFFTCRVSGLMGATPVREAKQIMRIVAMVKRIVATVKTGVAIAVTLSAQ